MRKCWGEAKSRIGQYSLPPPVHGVIPRCGQKTSWKAVNRYFVKLRTDYWKKNRSFHLSIFPSSCYAWPLTPRWAEPRNKQFSVTPFEALYPWCQEASKARQKAAEAAQSQGVRVSQWEEEDSKQFRHVWNSKFAVGCMIASEMDVCVFSVKWDFWSQLKMCSKNGIDRYQYQYL